MVKINDNGKINADSFGYSVELKSWVENPKDSSKNRYEFQTVGHSSTIAGALRLYTEACIRQKVSDPDIITINELRDYIENLKQEVSAIFLNYQLNERKS